MKRCLCALIALFTTLGLASPIELISTLATLPEDLTLPMERIFNQGPTSFCWAYSSFHSLRTYYFHTKSDSDALTKWKTALGDLNEPQRLRSYLDANFADADNEPMTFTRGLMQNTIGGLSDDWISYVPAGRTEFSIPIDRSQVTPIDRAEIAKMILGSLRKGAPSAFCGNGHCTTIYGATVENGQATSYRIADSVNHNGEDGRSYERDTREVLEILDVVMTLR